MADTGTGCLTVTRARACDGSGRHQPGSAPLGREDRMQFFFPDDTRFDFLSP